MIGGPDHGTEQPVLLALQCDMPGCKARLDVIRPAHGVFEELTMKQALRAEAEANGWYVARDRGAVNQNWDLCPEHAPPSSMRARESSPPISVSIVGGSLVMKREKP